MSNVGIFPGTNASSWQNYTPKLICANTATQPILSDPRYSLGRWVETNQGKIKFFAQITFQAADTFGAGEIYGISLPFPANRSSGGADLPIGTAFLWQGSSASPQLNMTGLCSLMDPTTPAKQGQEDSYVQTFLTECSSFGTVQMASGTTGTGITQTVTHNLGLTPSAYDIHVVPTNSPSTNPQWWYVDTITSTTFNLNIKVGNTGATQASFSWRARAWPNSSANFAVLMNYQRPWTWAAGHVIGIHGDFEARR